MRYPALKKLNGELSALTRYEFQRRCLSLLSEIWPGLVYSRELVGELDQSGIDLYLPGHNSDASDIEIVVQCKGIEVPNFKETHVKQCLQSIEKFASSYFSADQYYLIVNRYIVESKWRDEINKRLSDLVDSGQVKTATFLDISTFSSFLLNNIREILLSYIKELNNQHFIQYQESMGKDIYIDCVPFIKEYYRQTRYKETKTLQKPMNNPHKYLVNVFINRVIDSPKDHSSPKKLWTLVISEFGFGKTSLLLRLGIHLWNAEIPTLYIPAVEMPIRGFASERDMASSFLKIILRDDREIDDANYTFWVVALSSLLRSRTDLALLIDGLDEHRDAYSPEGIKRMFDCLRDYACPIVLSMRQEFWNERQGNLQLAMKKPVTNREIVFLTEWDEGSILKYAHEIQQQSGKTNAVDEFCQLIHDGKYEEVYGDIPKRPLFLNMLIDDLLSGEFHRMTLSHLYENYIIRKMMYDIESPFGDTGRPLPSVEIDLNDLRGRFLRILEQVARSTIVIPENNGMNQLLETFPESIIKTAAESEGLPRDPIIPFLLNTIIVTAGNRSIGKELSVRFAHRSFQEYFVARYLISLLQDSSTEDRQQYFHNQYSPGIETFVYEVLRDIRIQPDQSIVFQQCLNNLKQYARNCETRCLAQVIKERFEDT